MSTIIDALVVTLGLDPSGFKKGAQEASSSFKKTKEESEKSGKEMEARARIAVQVIDRVRNQVLALAATFAASLGVDHFIQNITSADAAVGRTAKNIDVSTETLTAWQGVAERAGGSAAGITGSMQGLSQQFQQLSLLGTAPMVPYFRAIGVSVADATGKLRPMNEILLDLSDKFQKMDPARAQALGKGLGLDEGTINVLMQGRAAITALLAEQKKLGAANKADADAAARRQAGYRALQQSSEDLGRKLLTALSPALELVLKGLTAVTTWLAAHPKVFATFMGVIGAAAATLTVALNVLAVRGFLNLISTMLKVPAAAAVASTATSTAAAATGGGLLTMLGSLAKSTALVAAAGAVGYAIGSAIYAAIEETKFADRLGHGIAKILAALGNQNAKESLELEERNQPRMSILTSKARYKRVAPQPEGSWEPAPEKPLASNSPKALTPKRKEQAEEDIQQFMRMGWTREQSTGIVANIQRESSGNERSVGDQGQAYGLAQWHQDRQREFTKAFGKDIRQSTRDEQLQFINYELRQGTEKPAGAKLAQTRDAASAAKVISTQYERPKAVQQEADLRGNLASSLYRGNPDDLTRLASTLYRPQPDPTLQGGAASALSQSVQTNSTSNTHQTETHIGSVSVILPNATDAESVATGLSEAMKRRSSMAAQANYGLIS